ncbi:hypothetical protein M1B72_10740 [Geomonas paludis]|uniref:Uncharacterized protein n=1 Tax=Geomonas paludis TaxID=2740185 RepID=A0A6V8MTE7_9BACT|nr:hypothetical protein [Geomonas paludis]UPU38158.1 hypothetical protein M1B72_10740 [Geomonas paludis]GFO63312.1 hypothetical protein GMPD_12310 [Geomonas paludis]
MKSTCPKCQAQIELDLEAVSEKGTATTCPSCKAKLYVHRESFGARAFRKIGQVSCAACGEQLGQEIFCLGCGVPYPEYLVTSQGSKPTPLPKTEGGSGGFSLPVPSANLYLPQVSRSVDTGTTVKRPQNLTAIIALVLVVALGAGGFTYYSKMKAEKAYVESFVKLTYCIHSGQQRSKDAATKIATEWKTANVQRTAPHMPADEEKDFSILATQIEQLQAKTATPPEKYKQSSEAVAALNVASKKMQALALSPSPTVNELVDATAKFDTEYQGAVRNFKSTLPDDMKQELKKASKRYKALQTLL